MSSIIHTASKYSDFGACASVCFLHLCVIVLVAVWTGRVSLYILARQTSAEAHDEEGEDDDTLKTREFSAAEWSAFWGWDCCGPEGILEQMYAALKVPAKSWPGLKRLPEVGGTSGSQRNHYLRLVSSYIQ